MEILQTHFGDLGAFDASNIWHSQETRQKIETTWERLGLHQALEQINKINNVESENSLCCGGNAVAQL